MCTSYKAGKDIRMEDLFDVDPPPGAWRDEIFMEYAVPIALNREGR
ncbi:hypothetical protein [Paraburkholderia sp. HD33-4]|nr:hypothetical protein [Paraburkholderia sp. HD33-4]